MVGQTVMRIVRPCFKPSPPGDNLAGGTRDGLLWYKDTGRHACGDFSMALVQANNLLEDASQLEAGPLVSASCSTGTFVGIYDGHGGPETANFIADHFLPNLKKFATEQQTISVDVIRKSYAATEEGFLNLVRKQWLIKPLLASVGSCCLVGIINEGVLYVANTGDSRAVLGRFEKGVASDVKAVQLSAEHNASIESVREELRRLHPHDPRIVLLKHNVWRVKGLIQVSRTLGDAYLKSTEFNREPLLARFRLPEPFYKPILCPEPSIEAHKLCTEDQFVIFASDGLWEHLTNQEAVDIVNCSPRNGIARRLIKAALREAAKKREMRYSDLKKIDRGVRRHFHDDITVVVLFLDSALVGKRFYGGPLLSLRGGDDTYLCMSSRMRIFITLTLCRWQNLGAAWFQSLPFWLLESLHGTREQCFGGYEAGGTVE
uniref:protein-serine/threonine phosphatase n=1 Tax=Leersia perrieri TaxID=77586 RepID=A0A0D9VAZ3_9ORYZ